MSSMKHETSNALAGKPQALRVVFLTGADSRSTRMSIEAVCAIPGVVPAAILLDTGTVPLRRRMKNLRNSIRKNGWRYLVSRCLEGLRAYTDLLAERSVLQPGAVDKLLRKAFPNRCYSLEDLGNRYGFPVLRVGNLNGPAAIRAIEECGADLGIVVGTRILKSSTFSVPRMGCINLHKGKVPEYRGMPPGFWELFRGAATAGVTVHFLDAKLDTGDIVDTAEVDILCRDTPETLLEKLHQAGANALVRAVTAIQNGTAQRRAQDSLAAKPNSKPTLRQVAELHRRLPHWQTDSDAVVIAKNLLYLGVYYLGIYALLRRMRTRSRAAVLLYHRVDDFSNDVLTVDTRSFAAHLLLVAKHYNTMSSTELVEAIRRPSRIPPTSVVIHFDDAYRSVYTEGGPILKAAGIPATAFVSSGFVNTERQFAHDIEKYPFRYENCRTSDLVEWVGNGSEIGAHTINHIDLGTCTLDEARAEIFGSGTELEQMIGRPVRLFSFPFGRQHNISGQSRDLMLERYEAVSSAYGGYVGDKTDVRDIPRIGANSQCRPLWLLMEIEGISPTAIRRKLN